MVQNVKYRVVLSADSIEVRNLASTRVLRHDEILARGVCSRLSATKVIN